MEVGWDRVRCRPVHTEKFCQSRGSSGLLRWAGAHRAGWCPCYSRVRACSTSGGGAVWKEANSLRACRWCIFRTGRPAPVVGQAAEWAAGVGRRTCCRAASAPPRRDPPPLRECRQGSGKTRKSCGVCRRYPGAVRTAGGSPAAACVPAQVGRPGTPVRDPWQRLTPATPPANVNSGP